MKVAQKPLSTGLASTSAESEPRPATGRASPYRPQHAMSPRVFSQSIQSFRPSTGTYQPLSMTTMNNAFAPENGVGINGTSSTSSSNTTTTNSNNSNKNTTTATASTSSSTSNTANSTMTAHTTNGAFASGPHSVLIRRLPINTTEDTLKLMVVWSKEFLDADVLSPEKSEDAGFRCAILRFKTHGGALEAKNMLDGKPNIANDAQMSVEVLFTSPTTARRYTMENPAPGLSSSTSSTASSTAPAPRQSSRFNGSFQSSQRLSPTNINASYASNELPNPGDSAHYQSLFSPQSPIGNHLTERTRITGKSLIKNDCVDDDETGELLKDPVAYAQNGSSTQGRRPTIPQIPISRMAGFCLNKTSASGSATTSNFAKNPSGLPTISQGNPMSPTSVVTANGGSGSGGPPVNYQLGSQHYQRHNFPPVNPADQNPPCNTLYVGNLPIDTSEDELKAMFSKQRGYKRLCFRTKQNGPMCFVEFEDVSFATKALHELYGHPLHNSIKGGIRLSFSKNPLGVRSGQGLASPVPPNATGVMPGMNGSILSAQATSFSTASGPPPGLTAPPGLSNRMGFFTAPIQPLPNTSGGYAGTTFPGSHSHTSTHSNNTTNHNNHHTGWHGPVFNGAMSAGGTAPLVNGGSNGFPPAYMMGR